MTATIANCNGMETEHNEYKLCYAQGLALANSASYIAALDSCDKALALHSGDPAGWVLRGVILIHLTRYAEALSSCEKALEIDSNYQEAWLIRGAVLNHLGRYKQSYRSYNEALGVESQSAWHKLFQLGKKLFVKVNFGTSNANKKPHL